jgi:hypothetical protein
MRKKILASLVLALVVFVTGCSSSADTEEQAAVAADLADAEQLVQDLSTISAYLLWYVYYYPESAMEQTDDQFIERLGTLVAGLDDENAQAAFYAFYQADAAYREVLATLPQDNSAWTKTQYENWVATGKTRADALGQVGGYLYPLYQDIEWFVSD